MTNFLPLLQGLLEQSAVENVLRGCHRGCHRLITFEDFCQEVLLRAVQFQCSFRGETEAELLAWLKALGRQHLITLLRRSRLEKRAPLPSDLHDPNALAPLEQLAPAEDGRRRVAWLVRVLDELAPDERELLVRRYFNGERLADIAQTLGVSPNTLSQRHARLLRRLLQFRER